MRAKFSDDIEKILQNPKYLFGVFTIFKLDVFRNNHLKGKANNCENDMTAFVSSRYSSPFLFLPQITQNAEWKLKTLDGET